MFGEGKTVYAALFHDCVGFEIYGVVPWLMLGEAVRGGFGKNGAVFLELSGDFEEGRGYRGLISKGGGVRGFCSDGDGRR